MEEIGYLFQPDNWEMAMAPGPVLPTLLSPIHEVEFAPPATPKSPIFKIPPKPEFQKFDQSKFDFKFDNLLLDLTKRAIDKNNKKSYPKLSLEMINGINQCLQSSPETIIIDKYNIKITKKDLNTLWTLSGNCKAWLNDNIIEFYLNMIVSQTFEILYAYNTRFLAKYLDEGYKSVKRWTRKINLFSNDLVFIPYNLYGVHWCLFTIDFRKKIISFYDSMGSKQNGILMSLLEYLKEEYLDKKKAVLDISEYKTFNVKDIPRQGLVEEDKWNCGIFTLKYALYLSKQAPMTFSQELMPYFRQKMVFEISKNILYYPESM